MSNIFCISTSCEDAHLCFEASCNQLCLPASTLLRIKIQVLRRAASASRQENHAMEASARSQSSISVSVFVMVVIALFNILLKIAPMYTKSCKHLLKASPHTHTHTHVHMAPHCHFQTPISNAPSHAYIRAHCTHAYVASNHRTSKEAWQRVCISFSLYDIAAGYL